MKFAQFQDSEPHIEGLVDSDRHLLHIEPHKLLVEDAYPLTLRFVGQLLKLCCVSKEPYVGVLGLVLAGLAVDRIIHELEELLLHLGLGGGTEICILRNVGL